MAQPMFSPIKVWSQVKLQTEFYKLTKPLKRKLKFMVQIAINTENPPN
jgi:hypothetical protein